MVQFRANFQLETAWLACLLCPALAWSGLGLSCLPVLPCLAKTGRQDRPMPDQAKAGHNRQVSQAVST